VRPSFFFSVLPPLLFGLVLWPSLGARSMSARASPPEGAAEHRAGRGPREVDRAPSAAGSSRGAEAPAPASAAAPDPLQAPLCPGVVLSAVSELRDPDASLATLRSADDPSPRARRFRGSVGERRVVYVGEDPRDGAPTAWLLEGRRLCRAVLRQPPPASPPPVTSTRPAREGDRLGLAGRVERVDAGTYRVDRSLVGLAWADGAELGRVLSGVRAQLVPDGLALGRVPSGSLPAVLGLASGDVLMAVNGAPLTGLEAMVRARADLVRSGRVVLTVVRGGQRREIVYEIT
jgi:hypothetical protein